MAFEIEKDIEMPERQGGPGDPKYPLAQMGVGDSFFVPWGEKEWMKTRSAVSNAVSAFHLRNPDKRFSSRRTGDGLGIRVWRVA